MPISHDQPDGCAADAAHSRSYPGVIIVEGLAHNADEFVYRIKQLQWKALQVRCELDGPVVVPPEDLDAKDAPRWAVRRRSHLGSVLDPDAQGKICVREMEGLNEVGEMCVVRLTGGSERARES